MSANVKMSYSAALQRVKIELTRAICLKSEQPPADLVARAKAKMEAVKQSGEIAFFFVYETRLQAIWQALRSAADWNKNEPIIISLAAGAPLLPGIKVDKPTQEKSLATLTIDAAKSELQHWRFEWFKLVVVKKMRDLGVRDYPNIGQLFSCFLKVKAGEKVTSVPIGAAPNFDSGAETAKDYSIVANRQRMEVALIIRNMKSLTENAVRDHMLQQVQNAVAQLNKPGYVYHILKAEISQNLQAALTGPEILGLDMPLVILAAMGIKQNQGSAEKEYAGSGKLKFGVSEDKMEARIADFSLDLYDDPSFQVNLEFIENELRRTGIVLPVAESIGPSIQGAIERRENLDKMLVVQGVRGEAGKQPYLYSVYKDAAARTRVDLDDDVLNIRDMQQRIIVESGHVVAEIRYDEEAVSGKNIFGEEVPPPPGEELVINLGPGIEQRSDGRFYALYDGIPVLENQSLSLSKLFVHKGDVNLRTGNIYFDGPVEITGEIDSGASVQVSGDLIVHGTIRNAFVKVGGKLEAKGGILTGTEGKVNVKGNISADFIENSRVLCGGDLVVTKAIISSEIICGGSVTVRDKSGVVGGGKISCRDSLRSANLGFKVGASTVLNVGIDWKVARAIELRNKRIDQLQKQLNADRQALREIVHRSKSQLTQRHNEMKDRLQVRIVRLREILEQLESRVNKANALLSFNQDSRVYVEDQLVANVNLTVAGQSVAISNDVAGVVVFGKRRRGSFFIPIEEVQKEDGDHDSERS